MNFCQVSVRILYCLSVTSKRFWLCRACAVRTAPRTLEFTLPPESCRYFSSCWKTSSGEMLLVICCKHSIIYAWAAFIIKDACFFIFLFITFLSGNTSENQSIRENWLRKEDGVSWDIFWSWAGVVVGTVETLNRAWDLCRDPKDLDRRTWVASAELETLLTCKKKSDKMPLPDPVPKCMNMSCFYLLHFDLFCKYSFQHWSLFGHLCLHNLYIFRFYVIQCFRKVIKQIW